LKWVIPILFILLLVPVSAFGQTNETFQSNSTVVNGSATSVSSSATTTSETTNEIIEDFVFTNQPYQKPNNLTDEGMGYYEIQNNDGTYTLTTHYPFFETITGDFIPYQLTQGDNFVQVEVNGGKIVVDKNSGAMSFFKDEKLIDSDSYVVRSAISGSDVWSNLSVNDEPVNVTVLEQGETLIINVVRENELGKFDIQHVMFGGKLKTTAFFTNLGLPENSKVAFTQTLNLPDNIITLNDQVIDLNQFVGQSFDRETLENNEDLIIEVQDLFFNTGVGFDNLWSVNIRDSGNDNTGKVSLDYANTEHVMNIGETIGLDPTWNVTGTIVGSNVDFNISTLTNALVTSGDISGTALTSSQITSLNSALNTGATTWSQPYSSPAIWDVSNLTYSIASGYSVSSNPIRINTGSGSGGYILTTASGTNGSIELHADQNRSGGSAGGTYLKDMSTGEYFGANYPRSADVHTRSVGASTNWANAHEPQCNWLDPHKLTMSGTSVTIYCDTTVARSGGVSQGTGNYQGIVSTWGSNNGYNYWDITASGDFAGGSPILNVTYSVLPNVPTGVSATQNITTNYNTVDLSWTGDLSATSYDVYRGGSNIGTVNGGNSNAWSFDGSNDYVNLTANTLLGNNWSFGMWLKGANSGQTASLWNFAGKGSADNSEVFNIYAPQGGGISYEVQSTGYGVIPTASLDDGQWHHVVITYDGSNMRAYVDNTLEDTHPTVAGGSAAQARDLVIGKRDRGSSTAWFDGLIDEMTIYNSTLGTTEISALYNSGNVNYFPNQTNLLAHYNFEQTGNTLTNMATGGSSLGSSANGTNNGATTGQTGFPLSTPTTFTDTSAPDSSNLSYTVDATNSIGTSGQSSAGLVETFYTPNAPTNLTDQGASIPLIIDWTGSTVNSVTNTIPAYTGGITCDTVNGNGYTFNGNVATSPSGSAWNYYARSIETFSPSTGGGAVEFTTTGNISGIGIGKDPLTGGTNSFSDIDHAMLLSGGSSNSMAVHELGTNVLNSQSYSTGDVMRIEVDGSGVVTYYRNGSLIYTSSVTASGTYYAHISAYTSESVTGNIEFPATSVTTPSPSVTGYSIERDDGSGFNVIVADTGNTNVQYSDSSASGNVTYRISGLNAVGTGTGATHNAVAGVPADAPSISLAWNDPATLDVEVSITNGSSMGTGTFSNYSVERSINGGVSWSVVGSPTSSPFIDTTIIGQSDYRVTTVTNHGISNYSTTASINTIPWNTITGINTSIADPNAFPLQISIGWDVATQGSGTGNLTGYELYRDGSLLATLGLVTAYTDNVTTSGTYLYDLKSLSVHGNSALSGNGSSITTPTVPTAINDLSATVLSDTEIDLNWTIPNNGGSNIIDYDILRDGVHIATITTNSYSDTGLTSNTQYAYQVFSRNTVGFSLISNPIAPTTHTSISGTLTSTTTQIGASLQITPTVNVGSGTPTPTFSTIKLYDDGVFVKEVPFGVLYHHLADELQHNITLTVNDSTHWNNPTFSNANTATSTYTPNWKNDVSYEVTRNPTTFDLLINRDAPAGWNLDCEYQTGTQAAAGTAGTHGVATNMWSYQDSQGISDGLHVYVTCREGTNTVLTFTSYGPNIITGGLNMLDAQFGDFLGAPAAILFVVLVAGLFTGRTANTGILVILALIGVLGFIGFVVVDEATWGFILLAGCVGLFVGRRFL